MHASARVHVRAESKCAWDLTAVKPSHITGISSAQRVKMSACTLEDLGHEHSHVAVTAAAGAGQSPPPLQRASAPAATHSHRV